MVFHEQIRLFIAMYITALEPNISTQTRMDIIEQGMQLHRYVDDSVQDASVISYHYVLWKLGSEPKPAFLLDEPRRQGA